MENINMATETVRTGPKSKAPEEKTVPIVVYARIIDVEKVTGKKMENGAMNIIRTQMRGHFAKLLRQAK